MNSKKILVCDDDQGIVDVLEVMLEMQGFTPITEIDSTKVITKIHENKPDLILLDLWMPLISGEQILRSIRSIEDLKDIPVIVFSASVEGDAIAFEAGADSFIAKPFDMNEIISKINLLLEKHSESNRLMQL
ncbi:PleD family two-component system response regulator [Chryseobacterium zhengzhouense]|uniref:PleD family two-component system response regulator n=1 Tax=Chryseobacterium zhengzhouense TaxID=1636086 RepID=A0ABW2LWV9_9FLAO